MAGTSGAIVKTAFFCLITLMAPFAGAELLPALPSESNASPHKLFIASDNSSQSFDSWTIDGGYAYNLFNDIDLYVGARIHNRLDNGAQGWLSGIGYQFTERLSFKSTLIASPKVESKNQEAGVSAELSSRLKLTENLDLHATLDYQEWQQAVEFGVGFRF
ncbi:hypothetical protein FG060_08855 [Vibrio cholerae]|nr:hypothetical protein [Vibrio cholerae]